MKEGIDNNLSNAFGFDLTSIFNWKRISYNPCSLRQQLTKTLLLCARQITNKHKIQISGFRSFLHRPPKNNYPIKRRILNPKLITKPLNYIKYFCPRFISPQTFFSNALSEALFFFKKPSKQKNFFSLDKLPTLEANINALRSAPFLGNIFLTFKLTAITHTN